MPGPAEGKGITRHSQSMRGGGPRTFSAVDEEHRSLRWVEAGARRRGQTAEEHLLPIFDVSRDWFRSPDFDTCAFVDVLVEWRQDHPLADDAGLHDTEAFAPPPPPLPLPP